ncbi:MAG: hypothetical protein AAGE01_22850 [Pseudomonadota bacterium]
MQDTIREQLRRNAVALISLTVAVVSLGYNTWRNETTEAQRNTRHASFVLVEDLARLQSVANTLVYAPERDPGAWVEGWGLVASVDTLGELLPEPIPTAAGALRETWEVTFEDLSAADRDRALAADEMLGRRISATREAVVGYLRSLD